MRKDKIISKKRWGERKENLLKLKFISDYRKENANFHRFLRPFLPFSFLKFITILSKLYIHYKFNYMLGRNSQKGVLQDEIKFPTAQADGMAKVCQ